MKLLLLYLTILILCLYTGVRCETCERKDINVDSIVTIYSPSHPARRARADCFPYRYRFTAPENQTLTVSCSEFIIRCVGRRKPRNYFKAGDDKKMCGSSFASVQSDGNTIDVEYKSANKKKGKFAFRFQCHIKVTEIPECDCGRRVGSFRSRIVGGVDAAEGELPYQVSFQYSDGRHYCGGSLISSQWVVTAAHCEVTANDDLAVLGEHTRDSTSGNELVCNITEVITHSEYNINNLHNDVAVVRLDHVVTFTDFIQPICLPDRIKDNSYIGNDLTASGWGDVLEGLNRSSNVLQKVEVTVISHNECITKKGYNETYIYAGSICTLTENKDGCQGDSGGPLADVSGSVAYLIGITSWGIGCAREDKPGVWADVLNADILKWIKTNAGIKCISP